MTEYDLILRGRREALRFAVDEGMMDEKTAFRLMGALVFDDVGKKKIKDNIGGF